jgi:putative flippase GtrA
MESRQRAVRQLFKFFSVSLAGGAIDACAGLICFNVLNFSLQGSATAGFCAGLVFGYFMHQTWTFAGGKTFDPAACAKYILTNLLLLAIRLGTVQLLLLALLHSPFAGDKALENAMYLIMLGISFIANYLFCRFVVFSAFSK